MGIVAILFGINTSAPFLLPNLIGMVAEALILAPLVIIMWILLAVTISIT